MLYAQSRIGTHDAIASIFQIRLLGPKLMPYVVLEALLLKCKKTESSQYKLSEESSK